MSLLGRLQPSHRYANAKVFSKALVLPFILNGDPIGNRTHQVHVSRCEPANLVEFSSNFLYNFSAIGQEVDTLSRRKLIINGLVKATNLLAKVVAPTNDFLNRVSGVRVALGYHI